jgi:hypothetical protein
MARGRMRRKIPQLQEALTGQFTSHHAFLLQMLLDRIDDLTARIREDHRPDRRPDRRARARRAGWRSGWHSSLPRTCPAALAADRGRGGRALEILVRGSAPGRRRRRDGQGLVRWSAS